METSSAGPIPSFGLTGIPGLVYGDIAIRPFQFEHDTITFGLIVEDDHGTDWAELYPTASASAGSTRGGGVQSGHA